MSAGSCCNLSKLRLFKNVLLITFLHCAWSMRMNFDRNFFKTSQQLLRNRLPANVRTKEELDMIADDVNKLSKVVVTSNVSSIPSHHPTLNLVLERLRTHSKPGSREDNETIALSIEGGGMRGCVSAGAAAALNFLGIGDAVDIVYGSSAGAMVGAYFVSRQFSGSQIYYDILPTAGKSFIDKSKLLEAAGIPTGALTSSRLQNFLATSKVDLMKRRSAFEATVDVRHLDTNNSRPADMHSPQHYRQTQHRIVPPVINLRFLLDEIMGKTQCLDWETFAINERSQPLHIVTSCVKSMSSYVLHRQAGHYNDMPSLLNCIRASMLVPGVTEPIMVLQDNHSAPVSFLPRAIPVTRFPYESNNSFLTNDHNFDAEDESTSGRKRRQRAAIKRSFRLLEDWMIRKTLSRKPGTAPRIPAMEKYRNLMSLSWLHELSERRFVNATYSRGREFLMRRMSSATSREVPAKPQSFLGGDKNYIQSDGENNRYQTHRDRRLGDFHIQDEEFAAHLCDAFLCEPIPYRTAVAAGATHIIALRTRPDPCRVLGKGPGVYELLIARRFFEQYHSSQAIDWLVGLQHHRIYAEDVLIMNEAVQGPPDGVDVFGKQAHILPIAVADPKEEEIGQLEVRREKIFGGMRSGARRVLEIFLPAMLSMDSPPEAIAQLLQIGESSPPDEHTADSRKWKDSDLTVDTVLDMIFPMSTLERQVPFETLMKQVSEARGSRITD